MPDYPDIPRIKVQRAVGAFPIPYLDKTAWDLSQWLKDIDRQYPGAKIGGVTEYNVDAEGRVIDFLSQPEVDPDDDGDNDWEWDNHLECLEVQAEVWETDQEYEHRANRIRRQRQQAARRQEQAAERRARTDALRVEKEQRMLRDLIRKHGIPEEIR